MSKPRILIIEDEEDILALIHFNLVKSGFQVDCAANGEEGFQKARDTLPDLILLDLMLPGMDGLEVCSRLRRLAATRDCPIIMLTARGEESDIVKGLETGADDYLPKPFSPQVLLARVRAVLRRQKRSADQPELLQPIEHDDLYIHPGRNRVTVKGEPVELTFTEFRILTLLAGRPGWVFTRGQIVDAVHGEDYAVTDRAVDVQIVGLRKKLGDCGPYIETVRGIGYRFKE
ncbi:MAG: response regulator transcription factor [Desulfuromonadales bacterium]|nr:response regulator transcription factor [Desulfuromonadales bacterium]